MNSELATDPCKVVESLGTSLGTSVSQRAKVVLVALGLRPAAKLTLFAWNKPPEYVEAKLTEAGLKFRRFGTCTTFNAIAEYAVAQSDYLAARLINASTPAEFGRLYGYPETAIAAFGTSSAYRGPLPDHVRRSMFSMVFSKEHHDEEFKTIERWTKALERHAPKLIDYHRKVC